MHESDHSASGELAKHFAMSRRHAMEEHEQPLMGTDSKSASASTPIVVDPSCSDIRERDAKRSAFHANLAKEQQATLEELLNNAPGWGGASS